MRYTIEVRKSFTSPLHIAPWRGIILFAFPILMTIAILTYSFVTQGSQQFTDLAQSFLHGHFYFLKSIGGLGQDPVLYHGKVYWDDAPFPAIVLMPFVWFFNLFHQSYSQAYLQWILVLGILYFVFKLARILKYSQEDSLLLMFGFMLGSVFIGAASIASSWLFAQVVTTFLLFWSLYEFYTRKRWWLLGVIVALIIMTRPTAAPIIIFFALELWKTVKKTSTRVRLAIKLVVPIVGAVILLGIYNYVRFQSPLNAGNKYQLLYPDSAAARSYGIFSLMHIPSNLYYMVFGTPLTVVRNSGSWTLKFPYIKSNPEGMSIFITSPYLIHTFMTKWSSFDSQARHLIVATAVSCFLIIKY
jgi:hypothetical protein